MGVILDTATTDITTTTLTTVITCTTATSGAKGVLSVRLKLKLRLNTLITPQDTSNIPVELLFLKTPIVSSLPKPNIVKLMKNTVKMNSTKPNLKKTSLVKKANLLPMTQTPLLVPSDTMFKFSNKLKKPLN